MKPPYESYYTRLKQELTGWKRALIVEETPLGYSKVKDVVVKLTIQKRTRAVLSQYKCRAKRAKIGRTSRRDPEEEREKISVVAVA